MSAKIGGVDGSPEDCPYYERARELMHKRLHLPDGRLGRIYMIERGVGGCSCVVSVELEGAKPRLFGLIKPKPVRYSDAQIELLREAPTEAEIAAILNDASALGLED